MNMKPRFLASLLLWLIAATISQGTTIVFDRQLPTANHIVDGLSELVTADDNATVTAGMLSEGSFVSLVGMHGWNNGSVGHAATSVLDGLWIGDGGNNSIEATAFDNQLISVRIDLGSAWAVFTTSAVFPVNNGGVGDVGYVDIDAVTGIVPELSSPGSSFGGGFLVVAVPEPSVMCMGMIACLGLMRRRRVSR